jgi:F0F1-type ATP synthase assembly protein I
MTEDSQYKKENKKKEEEVTFGRMFAFAADFAVIIAVPLLVFIYLGRWFDKKYSTEYFVVVGILLAILISSLLIYRSLKKITKDLKK